MQIIIGNLLVVLKYYARMLGLCLPLLTFCSCSKSNPDISPQVKEFTNKASMIIGSLGTNAIIFETAAAEKELVHLHERGELPIDPKDEHGDVKITCDMVQVLRSNELVEITYPLERTFHIVKIGETTTNNYTLTKQSKDSSWKLQRAWETGSNGQVIHEWPVP